MDIYKYGINTNYLYSYGNMFIVKKQEFSKMNWCCFWGNILLNYKVEFQGNTQFVLSVKKEMKDSSDLGC